jgi:glycosyltransferase involved in cell wall biosynthesis
MNAPEDTEGSGLKPLVSIIIATRNRADRLRRCLESLQACELPPRSFAEVLVVDNGCDDATRALVNGFAASSGPIRFRYLQESRRGKGFAVNSGVGQATGSILAFTDDDALVDKSWLFEIVQEFARDRELGLLAGRVEARRLDDPNTAVTQVRERKVLNGVLSLEGQVLGCNLAIRPAVLEKVKGRDTRLGPGRGLSCEDIDFTHRVLRHGFRSVFTPDALVYHDPGDRDRSREYLRGWGAFYFKFIVAGDREVTRQAWWKARRILSELMSGKHTYGALYEMWQMGVGASIMAQRLLFSRMV